MKKRPRDLTRLELQMLLDEATHILRIGLYAFTRLEGTSDEADKLVDRARAFLKKQRTRDAKSGTEAFQETTNETVA